MDNPYQSPIELPEEPKPYVHRPVANQRPTAVTVFGILNIIFGSFALLCTPFGLLFLLLPPPKMPERNPFLELLENPQYRVFAVVQGVVGIGAGIVLITAGIGLLQVRRWGRSLSLYYVSFRVLEAIVEVIFSYFYLFGPIAEAAGLKNGRDATAVAISGIIGSAVGAIFSLLYPSLLLIFMMLPNVAKAFEKPRARSDDDDILRIL